MLILVFIILAARFCNFVAVSRSVVLQYNHVVPSQTVDAYYCFQVNDVAMTCSKVGPKCANVFVEKQAVNVTLAICITFMVDQFVKDSYPLAFYVT